MYWGHSSHGDLRGHSIGQFGTAGGLVRDRGERERGPTRSISMKNISPCRTVRCFSATVIPEFARILLAVIDAGGTGLTARLESYRQVVS
jgi:hypothetical protein